MEPGVEGKGDGGLWDLALNSGILVRFSVETHLGKAVSLKDNRIQNVLDNTKSSAKINKVKCSSSKCKVS